MEKALAYLALPLMLFGCFKERKQVVTGTVVDFKGCTANAWLVLIDNPNPQKHSFICKIETQAAQINCSNSVFVTNLPAVLGKPGNKISFSRFVDHNVLCQSSLYAPHHLEVKDASEVN